MFNLQANPIRGSSTHNTFLVEHHDKAGFLIKRQALSTSVLKQLFFGAIPDSDLHCEMTPTLKCTCNDKDFVEYRNGLKVFQISCDISPQIYQL